VLPIVRYRSANTSPSVLWTPDSFLSLLALTPTAGQRRQPDPDRHRGRDARHSGRPGPPGSSRSKIPVPGSFRLGFGLLTSDIEGSRRGRALTMPTPPPHYVMRQFSLFDDRPIALDGNTLRTRRCCTHRATRVDGVVVTIVTWPASPEIDVSHVRNDRLHDVGPRADATCVQDRVELRVLRGKFFRALHQVLRVFCAPGFAQGDP
jgi:hypothetical protein